MLYAPSSSVRRTGLFLFKSNEGVEKAILSVLTSASGRMYGCCPKAGVSQDMIQPPDRQPCFLFLSELSLPTPEKNTVILTLREGEQQCPLEGLL